MTDYYLLIARAVAGLEFNTPESRQTLYDRARSAQARRLRDVEPPLSETEIEAESKLLEQAIGKVEGEAAITAAERASIVPKIVLDYAAFITNTTIRADCFYDVKTLPHSKELIVAAIEREIVRSPLEEHVNWLRAGALSLWNFIENIGPDPIPMEGTPLPMDVLQMPQDVKSADLRLFERSSTSSEIGGGSEKAANLMGIAMTEVRQIEERISAAVLRRKELRGLQ
jgi:hypothetical protein